MPNTLKPVSEQTIVITGGSSGNGLAIAEAAVERGANVLLVARNPRARNRRSMRGSRDGP